MSKSGGKNQNRASQSSSNRSSLSSRVYFDDDDAPPGERIHPGLLDDSDDALEHPSGGIVKQGTGRMRRRAPAFEPTSEASSTQASTTVLRRSVSDLDELQEMSGDSQSGLSSEQEVNTCEEHDALRLSCSVQQVNHCAGRYEIATRCANGRPVWQRGGGKYWLYCGTDGKWYIWDRQASDCDFDCVFGFVRSVDDNGLSVPTETAQWAWWDGEDWQPDGTITVQAAPQAQRRRSSSSSSVSVGAEATARPVPSEGSQGHHLGTCKPCAWYWSPGCGNGYTCRWCHLCPRGERQRRRAARKKRIKESKKTQKRAMRLAAVAALDAGDESETSVRELATQTSPVVASEAE